MIRTRRGWMGGVAFLVMVGCAGNTERSSNGSDASTMGAGSADSAMGAGGADSWVAPDTATADLPLCVENGGTEVRLAARMAGGGPSPPGTGMLAENGWQFLLVDGSCHAWVLPGDNDELVQTILSPAEREGLTRELKLGAWSGVAVPSGGCPDAPGISLRLGRESLSGSACGAAAGSAWADLTAAFRAQVATLAATALPASGAVRYLLIQDDGASGSVDSRKPANWPLGILASTVALGTQAAFGYRAGASHLATGNDAASLRAIRTTSRNGAVPGGSGSVFDYTPVVDAAGSHYRLFIRDEVPFAGADGLFSADVF